jgi:hypothetical protein
MTFAFPPGRPVRGPDALGRGRFATLRLSEGKVAKEIRASTAYERALLGPEDPQALCARIVDYARQLEDAGVLLVPVEVSICGASVVVYQPYLSGPTLGEWLGTSNRPEDVISLFTTLLCTMARLRAQAPALRIDATLLNFVVEGNRAVLVDVTPPLDCRCRPQPISPWEQATDYTKFEWRGIGTQLLTWALRELVIHERAWARPAMATVFDLGRKHGFLLDDEPLSAGVMCAMRLRAARCWLEGQIDSKELWYRYEITSLSRLRDMTEQAQRTHVAELVEGVS